MNRVYYFFTIFIFILFSGITGCKKEDAVTIPPIEASFTNKSSGDYFVRDDPNSEYKIPVGITTPSSIDTKVDIVVSSPTGAQEGVQYTIPSATVTIPVGKVLDSFAIKGLFSGLPAGRKDTLIIFITDTKDPSSARPLISNDTFTLVMQRYCDVIMNDFLGDYFNAYDKTEGYPDYGPYAISISDAVATSATKGYIIVDNLWDVQGAPIQVDLDWTNPSSFTTSIADQFLFDHPTYGPAHARGVGKGTFSSCDNSFSLVYEVYVGAGSYGIFTTEIKR